MTKSTARFFIAIGICSLVVVGTADLHAACLIYNSNGQPASLQGDPLFVLLQNSNGCPESVQGLKSILLQAGFATQPYMVANRGIHNPAFGSFSFFEQVSGTSSFLTNSINTGEFFFGHFTTADNGQVVADQTPSKAKLLVELIAWDHFKNLFNFYELIGAGKRAQWFYRGDSADILADNSQLYLNPQNPQFGSTLRCSTCHTSGGPIMKELAPPHNDWWTASRPLSFGSNSVSNEIATWVQELGDASDLSHAVVTGITRLESSSRYQSEKQRYSLQTLLRPLFCEMEVNLESDLAPLEQRSSSVQVPAASIISPFLAGGSISIGSGVYGQLLDYFDMRFPETTQRDADHGWLVPVKGYSDLIAIQSLIKSGVIDEEFVADVLAVDFENPLFSAKRCALVQLVPSDGLAYFPDRLRYSSLPGASELYQNLTDPTLTRGSHVQRAQDFLAQIQLGLNTSSGTVRLFKKLVEGRRAVFDAEISKNPRGQIFEPGFRVIFPEPN